MTPAQCRKVKDIGDLMKAELVTEALQNFLAAKFQPHERRNNLGTVSERGLEWLWAFLTQHRWRVNKASFRVGGRGRQAIVRYHSGS
ncbi:hypothetical protein HN873_017143, partial [Arachis hypogaea]